MNANFNHVNFGNVVVKDGNGNVIGTLIGKGHHNLSGLFVLTDKGYTFDIDPKTGTMFDGKFLFFYATDECSGTPYSSTIAGHVVKGPDNNLYYIQKYTSFSIVTINSYYVPDGGLCVKRDPPLDILALPLIPNDPNITGLNSSSFTTPLTIDRW